MRTGTAGVKELVTPSWGYLSLLIHKCKGEALTCWNLSRAVQPMIPRGRENRSALFKAFFPRFCAWGSSGGGVCSTPPIAQALGCVGNCGDFPSAPPRAFFTRALGCVVNCGDFPSAPPRAFFTRALGCFGSCGDFPSAEPRVFFTRVLGCVLSWAALNSATLTP